ncbi:hypothetical protein EAG18_18415 [Pseudoalteromonas sp. J010]|nr:hypothetical protein EAG18_18415 [Pseudoalteromonas sp. J010]
MKLAFNAKVYLKVLRVKPINVGKIITCIFDAQNDLHSFIFCSNSHDVKLNNQKNLCSNEVAALKTTYNNKFVHTFQG